MIKFESQLRNALRLGVLLLTGAMLFFVLVRFCQLLYEYFSHHLDYLFFGGGIVLFALTAVWGLRQIFAPHNSPKLVRVLTFNSGSVQMVADIVSRWKQHNNTSLDSWTLLQSASPVRFKGKVQNYPSMNSSIISIEVAYSFIKKGTLTCMVSSMPNNRIKLEYHWDGSDQALHNTASDDYHLLNYLMKMIETEFEARGCKIPGANFSTPGAASSASLAHRGGQQAVIAGAQQWWRAFDDAAEPSTEAHEHWPSPQDFSEAVQNPHISLADPDLKQSRPKFNSLGLPHVASGAFASVYKLSDGEKHWAVRCFNSKPTDQHERYQAISKFVLSDDLSYTVDFNYLAKGISHNGAWFPMLKMNWVVGESLETYISKHLGERDKLERIRSEFRTMMHELRKNGIAHGDLQHGNILVDHDSLYLVDYDGMFVPELLGRQSNELGHRNYQHPKRQSQHFGAFLDNFSAWLIDLSLLCLIEDPSLWESFDGGDECLLFRQSDLAEPAKSPLFTALRSHSSEKIRQAAERLYSLLQLPMEKIPYLDSEDAESPQVVSIPQKLEHELDLR